MTGVMAMDLQRRGRIADRLFRVGAFGALGYAPVSGAGGIRELRGCD